jgi:predicted RecB family nuclease
MERYELDAEVFERYLQQEYDLYTDLVVKYSDWPTYSYGIKQIANRVGFRWRDRDPSGANSIAWYNEYLKQPDRQDLLERILQYNEDDCRAMIAVKDYFQRHNTN